ncbi:uncharacterized protein [Aristolochia californica]|uniref:uncharacterized protein n=1 Tax=Aristolochia californica TaxID=171875 RepID=UPI0035DA49D8
MAFSTLHHPPYPFWKSVSRNFNVCTKPSHLKVSSCLAIDRTHENLPPTAVINDLRIVFAAGGTGGHIYPAIAIADEVKSMDPNVKVLFIGSDRGFERTIVPSAGFDFSLVPAMPLARPWLSPRNLLLPFFVLQSVAQSLDQLRKFNPQVVVGTGGYVSLPICLAQVLRGGKIVIQEQNSVPGIANKILGKFSDAVFVAFESCLDYFPGGKCVLSGNPVRASLRQYISKAAARLHYFPRIGGDSASGAQVVLVLGGSLGSNTINITLLNMYYHMLMKHKNRFIIWQTGAEGYNEMESLVKNHLRMLLTPYLNSMDLAYAAADIVVSSAGASTCSEILATGKPSILVPSSNVAEDHQTKNAFAMASLAGSKVLPEDELDSTTLGEAIDEILGEEGRMGELSERALKAARPDAASHIARSILSLVQTKEKP